MIEHLVISGGGTLTMRALGSVHYLLENKVIDINNIKTIFGTSAGAILGVCLSLKMDTNLIINYFVNRPWEDLYEITPQHLYNLYSNRGIFNKENLSKLIEPLFEYQGISTEITLEEFYQLSKIDIHMYTIELNNLEIIDLSHSSHPNLMLLDAIYMTSCIPFVFEPSLMEDTFYVDAGIIVNYPLTYCLDYLEQLGEYDKNTVFGFYNRHETSEKSTTETIQEGTMISYAFYMIKKLLKKSIPSKRSENIPNTITYYTDENVFSSLMECLTSQEKREEYIKEGEKIASEFNLTTC